MDMVYDTTSIHWLYLMKHVLCMTWGMYTLNIIAIVPRAY